MSKNISTLVEAFLDKEDYQINGVIHDIGDHQINENCQFSNKNNLGKKIVDEAIVSANNFTTNAKESPAFTLLDIVMASGRDYKKIVEPSMLKIRASKDLNFLKQTNSLNALFDFLKKEGNLNEFYNTFFSNQPDKISKNSTAKNTYKNGELNFVKSRLHFNDSAPKKMFMLFSILKKFLEMKENQSSVAGSDYDLIHKWAADPQRKFENAAGIEIIKNIEIAFGEKIPYIGPATIQHIRMHFGANTFKPDQRVKEVLLYKFY